jgi:hypothetical protein
LRAGKRTGAFPLSARPGDVDDPYYRLGTHPDVVEHLWDGLNPALPSDSRCVVLGRVALAHPARGVVLALAMGTGYALRLTPEDLEEALAAGHEVLHRYRTTGEALDLSEWGEGWCFGRYDRRERTWCVRAYEHYGT